MVRKIAEHIEDTSLGIGPLREYARGLLQAKNPYLGSVRDVDMTLDHAVQVFRENNNRSPNDNNLKDFEEMKNIIASSISHIHL